MSCVKLSAAMVLLMPSYAMQAHRKTTEFTCTRALSGTCSIFEDPHVQVFDGVQVSLLSMGTSRKAEARGYEGAGDKWVVKNKNVHIQARYTPDESLPDRNLFMRQLAVGGPFLQDSILVFGPLEESITFDGSEILSGQNSSFTVNEDDFFVRATRGEHSALVQDLSRQNNGVNVELPLGISLVVNRLPNRVNVAITMCPLEGGQEGQCGNFNGLAADESMEFISKRFDPSVLPEESLFEMKKSLSPQ